MALRFKLDENIPGEAGALLREAGHDVRTVLDQGLGGRPDDDVARVCRVNPVLWSKLASFSAPLTQGM